MRRLVDALRINGYAQTSFDELFGVPHPQNVADLITFAGDFATSAKVKDAEAMFRRGEQRGELKEFLAKYRDKRACEGGQVPGDTVGLFGLDQKLLSVVANATRRTMYYIMSDVWYVVPNSNVRERSWSQNWHRDPESECVIKVMVYFRDVDEDSGPLEYVRGSHLGKYLDLVAPGSYATRADADSLIADADRVRFCVPAGTVLFVNTSGMHRGGYTKSKPRLSGVWTYVG